MPALCDLNRYKERVDGLIADLTLEGPRRLVEACLYALGNGGKRFRPAIVYMVVESLSKTPCDQAALAVECFHAASLIADDLPCMDNDDLRRGKPALHKAFDEKTALLASYALIAEGYERVQKDVPSLRLPLAIAQISKGTGLHGATGGQYADLALQPDDQEQLLQMLYLKTGALFEVSFVLGWLIGGGDLEKLELVREVSRSFGLAFQIADDLDDYEPDGCSFHNFARFVGKDLAKKRLTFELQKVSLLLDDLKLSELYALARLIRR